MFIMDNDIIEVKIYFRKSGHKYIAYTEKEFNKETTKEEDKKKYSVLNVKMYELSWDRYNDLTENAWIEDSKGERQFSNKIYKENKMRKLIKEWDAKSKDDKPVPINEKSIGMMAPQLAESILRAYDEIVLIGDEEEKK